MQLIAEAVVADVNHLDLATAKESENGLMIGHFVLAVTLLPISLMPPYGVKPGGIAVTVAETTTLTPDDDQRQQIALDILGETQNFWSTVFNGYGLVYEPPAVSFFHGVVSTGCGQIVTESGLFYCTSDRKLYIDTAYFQGLSESLGVSGGYAQAFLIAHRIGNHVQHEMGIFPNFKQLRQQFGGEVASKMSVRVELQADCFAGMWGGTAHTVLVDRRFSHKH